MYKKSFTLLMMFILLLGLVACSTDNKDSETTEINEADLPVFNATQLAEYDGQNDNPAYVAYEGKVYDVSKIAAWKNGTHQGQLQAGKDYTDILNNDAPHASTNLTDNAPVVGIYE